MAIDGIKTREYKNFRGVDFSNSDVSLYRSPYSVNMWKNYEDSNGTCIETRPGMELLETFNNQIFGLFFYRVLNETKNCPLTYYAFFYTALKTGMRRGELLALEWSDVDFKSAKIWINKQIYRGKVTTTKTGKERYVDIPNTLIEVLKLLYKEGTLSKYVFHRNGKPLHPWNMENTYFKPLLNRCNKQLDEENQIRKFRFHDLRHSFATYLLSHGVPVKYVQERLGHSSARMTLDVYASFLPSVKYEALELLDKMNPKDSNNNRKIIA